MELHSILKREEYNFLRTEPCLGKNLILLGLSGSYSYGTNKEDSDIDIRGITLNQKSDLLGMTKFEQYVDSNTDTTIYSFNKMLRLLLECNPNTIELLGLNPEHYLFLSPIGILLLEQKSLFLSKLAINSFGGYAGQQLRRLQNAIARDSYPQAEKEAHILGSIKRSMIGLKSRYQDMGFGTFSLYLDKSEQEEMEQEIYLDVKLSHYPLRDYKNVMSEINNIVRDYDKIGKRNKKKDQNHLNKHAMHLIRLFMMAIDILEKGEIKTYRKEELPLLVEIRQGGFSKEDGTFREEFYELLSDYEKRLDYAAEHTSLPDLPDKKKVEEFMISVNERVIKDAF